MKTSGLYSFFLIIFLATTVFDKGFIAKAESQVSDGVENKPVIFWVSDPVNPGEVVLVEGGNWGDNPTIKLNWLKNRETNKTEKISDAEVQKSVPLTPLQVTSTSIKFVIPEDWETGVYSFQVGTGNSFSEAAVANAPDPWWQQGDWGKEASPGGWLRIFGKCLSLNGHAKAILKASKISVELSPNRQDLWSLDFVIPHDLKEGVYETWVHNGYGGQTAWRKVGYINIKQHQLWKQEIYDVRDFGAVANDEFEDSAPIQAALDAAGKNGGGIVSIPRGRFQINKTLFIPRFVLIRGAGAKLTELYWRDRYQPLDALLRGTNSFGMEDISIRAFNHLSGIVADNVEKTGAGNIFLKRLQIHMNRFEQVPEEVVAQRLMPLGGAVAIKLGGENFQIIDCEIFSSQGLFGIEGNYGVISGNQCFQGFDHKIRGSHIILENNVMEGGMLNRGGWSDYMNQRYYANNRVGNMHLWDAEVFSTDGNWHEVVEIKGKGELYTLNKDVNWKQFSNGALSILKGKGAGQLRNIKSFSGREVVLEEPWAIVPDETSLIIISEHYKQNLLIGNEFHDGAIVQSFTRGLNWVFAKNKVYRIGGIHNAGRGTVPSWFTQYFDNEILYGNSARGPWNEQPPRDAHFEVNGAGALGAVFRRNILHANARIQVTQAVQDVVIDHNTIKDADVGIDVSSDSRGVLLWQNQFERVKNPLSGNNDEFWIHPAERILNRIEADKLIPEMLQYNNEWQGTCKRLNELCKKNVDSSVEKEIQSCQLKMLQLVSSFSTDEKVRFSLFKALTGFSLSERSTDEVQYILRNATGGEGKISLNASVPAWSVPVNLSLKFDTLSGWQSSIPKSQLLKPGKSMTFDVTLTIPEGIWGTPFIPVVCEASGEQWKLKGRERVQIGNGNKVSPDMVSHWMVIGPFTSDKPGELGDKVYPPEIRIDVSADYYAGDNKLSWQSVKLEDANYVDFSKLYGTPENGVAFGLAVLQVKKPTIVAITTNGGTSGLSCNTYLDGELLGVPFRYGSKQVSRCLTPGYHVLLCGVAKEGQKWQLNVQVTVDPAANPGNVVVLPTEKFKGIAAVSPPANGGFPEGNELPFSDGYNWQLVYEDDFNRTRLGEEWSMYDPQAWYESKSWHLENGHLASRGISYFEYISYAKPVSPPVRVECDFIGDPERVKDWFQAITLTPRNQVGGRRLWGMGNNSAAGAGYMLAVGWNRNPQSTELWRENKKVQVNLNSPQLEPGRKRHIIAQFSPKRILLIVDGVVSLDYHDPVWIKGLDTVSFMNGFGCDWFDNVRIYEAKP